MSLLVSCIMPTKGRPQFVQRAIDCYLSQDWDAKELVILDDVADPSFGSAPEISGLQYSRVKGMSIGTKRNLLCSQASGSIIIHWDDDDWSASTRITDQVMRLAETKASITGYNVLEFRAEDGRRWMYHGSERYACGTSLCYLRSHWQNRPFPDLNTGEDNAMVYKSPRLVAVPANGQMWASIHPGNTCVRFPRGCQWKELLSCA